jgi:hypothetical protein
MIKRHLAKFSFIIIKHFTDVKHSCLVPTPKYSNKPRVDTENTNQVFYLVLEAFYKNLASYCFLCYSHYLIW